MSEYNFLNLTGKTVLVTGVANRKSVAAYIGKSLIEAGAKPIFSVQTSEIADKVTKIFPHSEIFICDVTQEGEIQTLANKIQSQYQQIHGLVHSIAFADYPEGKMLEFHQTDRHSFLEATKISCFSLIELSNAFKDILDPQTGSVVTISISTTKMAAEPYGYMAPIKAALDSSICFLAKSFSSFSRIRFNSVKAGLLKTSASAGIPGYIDYYLYAEQATLRKQNPETSEVANTAIFLLSEAASGINAQGIVVDAGMAVNYFDRDIVKKVVE